MIKYLFIAFIFLFNLNASDDLTSQKQNTLYVQNLIEIEEKIAKSFEKYILTEFKLPTMEDLIDDNYLGSNFSIKNRMGIEDIGFLDTKELKIKYLVSNDAYSDSENYIVKLYNRDLYRDFTSVYFEVKESNKKIDTTKSYVEIKLQSDEAKTIFELLKNNFSIEKSCSATLTNTYCNNNQKTIRWYNQYQWWIEYSKKDFNKGNITTTMSLAALESEAKIADLKVGAYIFIKDSSRYVKLTNFGNSIQILKVD